MKTLKLMFGVLFAMLLVGQVNAGEREKGNFRDPLGYSNDMLRLNSHVFKFIPSDTKSVKNTKGRMGDRGFYDCDQNGTPGSMEPGDAGCGTYHSTKTDTSWVVRYVRVLGKSIRVNQIFKISNGQLELYAEFDPKTDANLYASNETQKFAGTHGSDNNEVAEGSGSTSNRALEKIDALQILKGAAGFLPKF